MRISHSLLAVALVALAGQPAIAQVGRDAEIVIEADDAELDRRSGVTVYRGNVRIAQGGLELRGDEVALRFDNGQLMEANVSGSPASMIQEPNIAAERTRAEANAMTFTMETGIVHLRGAARVIQGGDEFASEDIRYDTRTERVVAGGEPGARIQVTITPRRPADGTDEPEPDPEPEPRE